MTNPRVVPLDQIAERIVREGRSRVSELKAELQQPSDDWRQHLLKSERSGTPKPLLANCMIALRQAPEWHGVLGFDEFQGAIAIRKEPPINSAARTPWSDHLDRLLTEWLQREGISVGVEVAAQAAQTAAQEHPFHPVREYLESLQHDGRPRIDTWLTEYLGVEDSNYARAVGSRWIISAIARVFKPGAKADCCLILEGPQGIYKSTALRALSDPWFTDEIADLGSKDASLQAAGAWIIEIAELDSMNRSEVGRIKAFISRNADRFRPPYGRRVIEAPRQCVFAGTVNHSNYLRDETGARRFWPVECHSIKIDELRRDRDQLWAEAVVRFKAGEAWWLDTRELIEAAGAEQSDRYERDPWEEPISAWAEGRSDITIDQVLRFAIGKTADKLFQADQNRASRCLRALGWSQVRIRSGEDRQRVWRRHE